MSGKNFTKFNGQFLIDKTVEFATKFDLPIYVSTDYHDWEFKHPVKLIKRPSAFAKDTTPMRTVWEHAKSHIKEDVIILLQPTSPLRKKKTIENCIAIYETYKGKRNIVTTSLNKPNGYCFIFPRQRYIWDHKLFLVQCNYADNIDIDYIWDFRIAEAIERGDYS
jgi:CMP-N-acetylneuraminic acid synthetase